MSKPFNPRPEEVTPVHSHDHSRGREYIIDLALGYQLSQVLFAALHLNIFNLLDGEGMHSRDLAQALHADNTALKRFLNVLVDAGLLEHENGFYRTSGASSRYLVKGKRDYLGNRVHHYANLWHFWEGLEERVRSGRGKEPDPEYLNAFPGRLKDYLAAMDDGAAPKAETIARALAIGGCISMLDIGCGPGTYAVAFAEYNHNLAVTMLDLELNLCHAREKIDKSRAGERIRAFPCQVLEDEIPGCGYDLVFISNLIHLYAEEEVRHILAKAWDVLAPSGRMVIHDYILPASGQGRLRASLFDLAMLVGTPRGRCYTIAQLVALLEALGARSIREISIDPDSSLLVGEKKKREEKNG